jgi:hypothetical protein
MMTQPPEKLDVQPVEDQQSGASKFLTSLPRFRSGWFANKGASANSAVAFLLDPNRLEPRVAWIPT